MAEQFKYDVFISHSAKDKLVVRELAERLRRDGLRVCYEERELRSEDAILSKIEEGLEEDEWEMLIPGTRVIREIEDSLEGVRTLVLMMSEHVTASEWVMFERHAVLFRDPSNQQRRFIPVRLDNAEIKDTLRQFAYMDWRQRDDTQYAGLFTACCLPTVLAIPNSASQGKQQLSRVLIGHKSYVQCVAVTMDGKLAISGSGDNTVRVWEVKTGRCLTIFEGHTSTVYGVAVTANGQRVISCSEDKTVRVWEVETGRCLTIFEGHTGAVWGVAVTADGQRVISGSEDKTVRIWEVETGRSLAKLEGHTGAVWCVVITADGRRAISGSEDKTVRVWEVETGRCLTTFEGHTGAIWGVAVTADGRRVVSGAFDNTVRVWVLPPEERALEASAATRYTNAKVLLVGDSGVGKSGLALRLTEDYFEPTISTDGAVVTRVDEEWATQIKLPHENDSDDIEREIWLWDFAGQSDYRLIHQLFMDETALAVLVFNPQAENPFEGLGQWDRSLEKAARRKFNKLLVAGRCDRGGLTVSRESVESFGRERGFADYLETSAQTGAGCDVLCAAIISNIGWDEIPWTASPHIFKLLKEGIVKLKDEGKTLLRMGELKQQLEMLLLQQTLQDSDGSHVRLRDLWQKFAGQSQAQLAATLPESFTPEQLRAVVGLLAGPGRAFAKSLLRRNA